MRNNNLEAYPYLTVIILFAGVGSVVGGLIAELAILLYQKYVKVVLILMLKKMTIVITD